MTWKGKMFVFKEILPVFKFLFTKRSLVKEIQGLTHARTSSWWKRIPRRALGSSEEPQSCEGPIKALEGPGTRTQRKVHHHLGPESSANTLAFHSLSGRIISDICTGW